jgi:glycosyltransferase involved in cell wall biosynthesis
MNRSECTEPEAGLDGDLSHAREQLIRVLLIADARSPTTWGWIDAVRSTGITVLGTDGKEWSERPAVGSNDRTLGARLNRGLRSFSKATPRRLIAIHELRRLVGPSLARLKGRQLRRLVNRIQPDLIHALRIPYEGIIATAACPPNVPLAVSIWGNDLTLVASANPLIACATRRVLARADLLYADCQRDLDLAKSWGLRPTASTSLLPGGGGIDLEMFTELARHSESPHDESPYHDSAQAKHRIVLNARGLREYVRNDTLLRALAIVAPDIDSRVRIIFVGVSGNKDLGAKIARHPLADKIVVTGERSSAEMAGLFHRAEVNVSITDHDGTPNSLLEAMAAGAIPVCGDIPSIREWIQPGRNGFLADPSDPYKVASALRFALNLSAADREVIIRENKRIIATRAERQTTGREAARKYRRLVGDTTMHYSTFKAPRDARNAGRSARDLCFTPDESHHERPAVTVTVIVGRHPDGRHRPLHRRRRFALRTPREAGGALAFDYFCPGIRMGFQTAMALESAALLRSAHVDVCLAPGKAARVLERAAGPRVANRVVRGVPAARIHRHPQLTIAARIRRRLRLSGQDTTAVDRMLIRIFASIARQCDSEGVVGTQSSSLELFEGRAHRIMEQVSPPLRYERAVAAEELERFPGWAHEGVTRPSLWDHRMEAEWQAGDLILVPSRHLIAISQQFGADPLKFCVVPYPIARPQPAGTIRSAGRRRTLRVVFAGTLMLEKGVQYIYEALIKRPDLPVQMEFFGPINLTPFGVQRLMEVGTVHGSVPRVNLFEELRRADILIFPSLSEGSALVTLEAAALGLPVVATKEAGAPASAMAISSRSPEAIIEAIEALSDDPGRLEILSAAGLAEAEMRNLATYTDGIVDSIERLTGYPGSIITDGLIDRR